MNLVGCSVFDRINELESFRAVTENHLKVIDDQVGKLQERVTQDEENIEDLSRSLEGLRRNLEGWSKTTTTIPKGTSYRLIFGNSSGHHAKTTITNRGLVGGETGISSAFIIVRRITKPADPEKKDVTGAGINSSQPLPVNFITTKPLLLDALGAQRQMRVPCGYELVGMSADKPLVISVLIEYEAPECVPE